MYIKALTLRSTARLKARFKNSRYHFKHTPWQKIRRYQANLRVRTRLPWLDLLYCSWRYGASPMDYYCLRFFEKSHRERQQYLTTSRVFALRQSMAETPEKTLVLRDKFLFNQKFQPYLGRDFWTWEQLRVKPSLPVTLVMKDRWGQGGEKIRILSGFKDKEECLQTIRGLVNNPSAYLYESHLLQHPLLAQVYPHVINSVKVLTCIHQQRVDIWVVMLSLGTQAHVDNFTQEGLALAVNAQGVVCQPATYLDPDRPLLTHHPHTDHPLLGFQIPFFEETLNLCRKAAKALPETVTVSWDVAIQPDGPCLIEANHNWSAYIQIPAAQGLASRARAIASLSPYD
jgi:hypothetical protein